MHKTSPDDVKPCPHMRTLVSAWVDNRLTGLARWYTQWHVSNCAQCQSSLPFLEALRHRMGHLSAQPAPEPVAPTPTAPPPALPDERWAAIDAAWSEAERKVTSEV